MKTKTKTEVILPTDAEIPALTDRVAELNAQIALLATERDSIEARLKAYALKHSERHEPLKDEKREGRRCGLSGTHHALNVVIASDLIIGTFPDGGPKHKELLSVLCEEHDESEAPKILKKFFTPPCKWENLFDNGLKFRAAVAERLAPKIAPKFIAACTQVDKFGVKKNTVSIDYKTAKADGKADA